MLVKNQPFVRTERLDVVEELASMALDWLSAIGECTSVLSRRLLSKSTCLAPFTLIFKLTATVVDNKR